VLQNRRRRKRKNHNGSGRIVGISESFAEGAEFDPGEALIKIDDTNYKLAVIRAKARVAEAMVAVQRELANAKIKAEHWLDKRNSGEPSPYALNKPQVLEAEAKLLAAEADLKEARLNVARTEINAPFLGRVSEKSVGIGQYVTAGTALGRVFSTDIVEIRLPLTDGQLAELNLPIGFMTDGYNAPVVRFTAHVGNQEHTWTGRIVRTNASVDSQTRMVYAIDEVEDPYGIGSDAGAPIAVTSTIPAAVDGMEVRAITREQQS